jgi:hypothetical protein
MPQAKDLRLQVAIQLVAIPIQQLTFSLTVLPGWGMNATDGIWKP